MRVKGQTKASIDWAKPINFEFNGKNYVGYAGDTLASALLAYGNRPMNRSFKFGRKRGIFATGVEEPNALISLEQGEQYSPNFKATEIELYEGLKATTATKVDGLDLRAMMRPLHKFIPAGFYYKTFIKQKFWSLVENNLRALSGFSKPPTVADNSDYDHNHLHIEILVIGAGAAGISATLHALENSQQARVMLVDERATLGGEMLTERAVDQEADSWLASAMIKLAEYQTEMNAQCVQRLRVFSRTTAYAWSDHNAVCCLQRVTDHKPVSHRDTKVQAREIVHKIRAKQIILATGAHERPMLFQNNDLINIMLSQSLRRYINQYAVLSGKKIVVYGNNDSIVQTALDVVAYADQVTLIDVRLNALSTEKLEFLKQKDIVVYVGYAVIKSHGGAAVKSVEIAKSFCTNQGWEFSQKTETLVCDLLATSGGFNPVIHLSCHALKKPFFNEKYQSFMVDESDSYYELAGSVSGLSHWSDVVVHAQNSALRSIAKLENENVDKKRQEKLPVAEFLTVSDFAIPDSLIKQPKVFVDFQNDVKTSDILLAIGEGYNSIELVKRYTALGFGTDQGKTGNINGAAVAAKILGKSVAEVGTTTFRPAYTGVSFGALAGGYVKKLFDAERFTPIHQAHIEAGAEYEHVGQWYRPWYFPKPGESMYAAVQRECIAARTSLAMMDASTLGKIDIQGADAREFLNRVYTNAWEKLAVGRCCYGIMCDEKGMIIDDGVTACVADNHFLMTTTTGGAASVYSTLEMWLQTEWDDLNVHLTSVTDHYSTIAVVGPEARKLMRLVCQDIDFDHKKFKFMDWLSGTVCGVPARVMRISFSGELAYEINIKASYGLYVWKQLAECGKQWDIAPYGTETLHVLRAEKGYIIVGQDTDGSVTPMDTNMRWILNENKQFSYIGKRSFTLDSITSNNRKQLVGIHTQDKNFVLPEGTHFVDEQGKSIGHVTSSYYSAACNRSIALALVLNGFARLGDIITAHLVQPKYQNRKIICKVVNSVHYDVANSRVDGNA